MSANAKRLSKALIDKDLLLSEATIDSIHYQIYDVFLMRWLQQVYSFIYNTLMFGAQYVEYGEAQYKQKQEEWEKKKLVKLAKKYDMALSPADVA